MGVREVGLNVGCLGGAFADVGIDEFVNAQ